MSTSKRLEDTLNNLDLDSSAEQLKERVISNSMKNIKERMSGLDIQVERQKQEVVAEEQKPHYDKLELADVARGIYRDNINPLEEKAKVEVTKPSTIASRANMKAISRSLAGMRTSGNEGKTSPVGPNGVGNLGKLSPTGENGSGNVGTNTVSGNYYALTTDMTLEEYEQYVQGIFEGDDCECQHKKERKLRDKKKEEINEELPKFNPLAGLADMAVRGISGAARGLSKGGAVRKIGAGSSAMRAGSAGSDSKRETTKEDVVHELEQRLVTLGSTDWIQVDQVLREMARELDVAPRTLSREFKSIHGIYPDKWIKEHLNIEMCGYMPLEEAARLNKCGTIYEVSFMFRGGTNRLKFFWPFPGVATREDMQREVEKFWPKAKLIAFYPTQDNLEQSNFMVMAPPVTENYKFLQPEEWTEVPEYINEAIEEIAAELGEPISPLMNEEGGYALWIEDHDTGEQTELHLNEEGLRDWFGKSSSKDGKSGWVNVVTGGTCASDEPGEGTPKCVSSSKRASMSEAERKSASRRKKAADPNQQSKSGAAKPTYVSTDKKTKKESVDCPVCGEDPCQCLEGTISEEKDKKGKGSGSKDACYNKVKSRYSVWPSAYASGALVKCRQKGAANWGNSSKKEEVEYMDENRRAARAAGGYVDDGKKQPDPSKPGFTGVGNMSIKDIMKMNKDIEKRTKKEEVDYVSEGKTKASIGAGVGDVGGKVAGGLAGAALGSPIPVVGSAIGGALGAKVGGALGAAGGAALGAKKGRRKSAAAGAATGSVLGGTLGAGAGGAIAAGYEPEGEMLDEKLGGAGSLVRQGIKLGGKKGGRAVQAGTTAATKKGKEVAAKAKQGGEGAGKNEKLGAKIGGTLGAGAGFFIPDGPAMVAGEIAGGVAGSKLGGAIGKKFDKKPATTTSEEVENVDEACWKGYEKKGMKTMFGKRYPNCVKKEEYKTDKKYDAPKVPGNLQDKDRAEKLNDFTAEKPAKGGKNYMKEASPAWQRKEGKRESGGLNQKGVDSYRRANPGSKLKTAVTTEPSKLKKGGKAAGRRKSFCSRMKGMKSKLTSAKTARDPDSRINKSLRKWNC